MAEGKQSLSSSRFSGSGSDYVITSSDAPWHVIASRRARRSRLQSLVSSLQFHTDRERVQICFWCYKYHPSNCLCPPLASQQLQLVQRSLLELLVIPYTRVILTVSDPSERRSSQPSNPQKYTPVQVRILWIDTHAVLGQRVEDETRLTVSV